MASYLGAEMKSRTLLGLGIIPLSLALTLGCSEQPQYTPNTTGTTPPAVKSDTTKKVAAAKRRPKDIKEFTGSRDVIPP